MSNAPDSSENQSSENQAGTPQWQPLSAIDRRVLGVLVEKAKTTPDNYPMSLNAVCTACNQKSNRRPVMNLEPADVEASLERLRKMGAVGFVSGYGRVEKYRHYLYEWLGVDKVELAVMAELLLRGPQTVGELRTHVARMEPIRHLEELLPIVASLRSKNLVVSLSPEGRGQVVTHALYPPGELERLQAQYGIVGESVPAIESQTVPHAGEPPGLGSPQMPAEASVRSDGARRAPDGGEDDFPALRREVAQLRAEVEQLSRLVEKVQEELARLRADLGG